MRYFNRILFLLIFFILLAFAYYQYSVSEKEIVQENSKINSPKIVKISDTESRPPPRKKYFMAMAHKGLLFRSDPDINSKAIGLLPFGMKGEIMNISYHPELIGDKSGVWLNINYAGKEGWIFSGYTYMSDYETFEDILDSERGYWELNSDDFMNPSTAKEVDMFSYSYEDKDYKRLVSLKTFEQANYEVIIKEFDETVGSGHRINWINLLSNKKIDTIPRIRSFIPISKDQSAKNQSIELIIQS